MTNQEVLIQEVQDEISAEMPERLRVIETAQEKDKKYNPEWSGVKLESVMVLTKSLDC